MLSIQKVRKDPCSALIRRAVLLKKRGGNTSATATPKLTMVVAKLRMRRQSAEPVRSMLRLGL